MIASIVASVTAIAGAPAGATTRVQVRDPVTEGRGAPGEIDITGDEKDNRIAIRWNPDSRALIVQVHGPVRTRRCSRLTPTRVSCPFAYDEVWINGNKGRDHIVVHRETTRFDTIFADGGPGSDVVTGGDGHDFVTGGDGNDVLNGRGAYDAVIGDFGSAIGPITQRGDDIVRGGGGRDFIGDYWDRGSDEFFGGPGNDEITGRDVSIDRIINGGPGEDDCSSDPRDPRPKNCEGNQPLKQGALSPAGRAAR